MAGSWTRLLVIAAFAAAGTAALLPAVRRLAVRHDAIDLPRAGKAHTTATPYLGGVAIAVVVSAASLLTAEGGMEGALILACALSVGALGLADDIWDIRPGLRVAGEAAAAVIVCLAGARVELFGGAADVALTVAWVVLLTNAFNLLDNMDGCAGLVAAVTATAVAVAAGLQGQTAVGGVAAAVAGSSAAFLLFNWFPARIFMGDAGSLFIGFLLSTITLQLRFSFQTRGLPALVLLAGPALFDTALVVLSRLLAGRPVAVGATDHTSHRLRQLGLSVPAVATVIGAATAACATVGVLVGRGILAPGPALAATVALASAVLVAFLLTPVNDAERSADDFGRRPPVRRLMARHAGPRSGRLEQHQGQPRGRDQAGAEPSATAPAETPNARNRYRDARGEVRERPNRPHC